MRFLAIDLETANADRSSICAIGAVLFEDGEPAREWYSLVDPEDYFDWINVEIHGIDAEQVRGVPKFPDAFESIVSMGSTGIAVSHTSFDPVAIRRATEKHRCQPWDVAWLDSAQVARRAWPERFAASGYGLASVAEFLGIKFQHHNALEDARVAGQITCQAVEASGLPLEQWLDRVCKPISPESSNATRLDGNPEGPFSGESITFTGALVVPRREAAEMAARVGFNVLSGVSKKTSVFVVGDQDARKLHGHSISSKHQKAQDIKKQYA